MDIDDEEDFYDPEPSSTTTAKDVKVEGGTAGSPPAAAAAAPEQKSDVKAELEEGEEEDEGGAMDEDSDSDSDIDIITERKDGTKAAPPTQSRYSDIRNIPQRSTSNEAAVKPAAPAASKSPTVKPETPSIPLAVPSADKAAAAASNSKIDVEGNPIHSSTGKRITAINIDEDLAENEKPWRKPGTDISDYFNYGFDEFTWALYAAKQESIRGEFNTDSIMGGNKKMMEDFGMMMMGGNMNMPGGPQAGAGQGAMPGMDGMPQEMQAMMQAMMSSGMDPSQMDPSAMSAMFSGMQGQGGQAGQAQNFGGQGGFGGNQQFGGGYDQQGMGGGGGRGGFGGRGRGRRW